jgi:hypothetical protein
MTDESLISAKQVDGFKTESPIRAFTDFQVAGQYAIGKGFRPSLAHLSRYLDAMQTKEGWGFVQMILPRDSDGDPTILFHRKPELLLTPDMEVTSELPEEVDLTIRKIVIGLGQLRDDMIGQAEGRMEDDSVEAKGFLAEAMDQYADRAAGYAAELAALVPVHGATATLRALYAQHGEAVGRSIRELEARGLTQSDEREPFRPGVHGGGRRIGKSPALAAPYGTTIRGKCDWEMVNDFLKDQGFSLVTDGTELRIYRADAPTVPPMTSAAVAHEAEGPIPTGIYWSGEHANFYDAVTRKGQGQAFMDAWYFRRAEFPAEPNDLGEKTDD